MTLQQIDEALNAWNRRLTAMADNLMSLQSESAYQMLTGSGSSSKLQVKGETAARVAKPLGAIRAIFEQFDMLHSVVDRAAKIREGLPSLFGGDEKLTEILQLLFGRSIELTVAAVTLEDRTLLSGAPSAQRLTPEELLGRMAKTFAEARDVVLAVDRAWQQTAERLVRAETQIGEFDGKFAATGCGASSATAAELRSAKELLAELTETLRSDPLSAQGRVQSLLEPALARLRRLVDVAELAHREMQRARADLASLKAIHGEALDASAEAKAKIAVKGLPAPVAEEKLHRLGDWLEQLDRRWAEGALETVSAGLRHWQEVAKACLAEDTAAREASRSAVAARRELRGRLDALKAKARAMGVAELAAICAIATEAESLLASRPTDLERASAAVVAYGRALGQAARPATGRAAGSTAGEA